MGVGDRAVQGLSRAFLGCQRGRPRPRGAWPRERRRPGLAAWLLGCMRGCLPGCLHTGLAGWLPAWLAAARELQRSPPSPCPAYGRSSARAARAPVARPRADHRGERGGEEEGGGEELQHVVVEAAEGVLGLLAVRKELEVRVLNDAAGDAIVEAWGLKGRGRGGGSPGPGGGSPGPGGRESALWAAGPRRVLHRWRPSVGCNRGAGGGCGAGVALGAWRSAAPSWLALAWRAARLAAGRRGGARTEEQAAACGDDGDEDHGPGDLGLIEGDALLVKGRPGGHGGGRHCGREGQVCSGAHCVLRQRRVQPASVGAEAQEGGERGTAVRRRAVVRVRVRSLDWEVPRPDTAQPAISRSPRPDLCREAWCSEKRLRQFCWPSTAPRCPRLALPECRPRVPWRTCVGRRRPQRMTTQK
jgi:hypothetical protein